MRALKQYITSFITALSGSTSSRVVTLDINGKSIKLMEARGETIKRWASTSFDTTNIEDDLGMAVKRLMVKSGITANKVILSLSGLSSSNRILQSPTSSLELMNPEAIQTLVDEEMTLTEEHLYLSWKIIQTLGGESQLYVMGFLREELDSQIRSLKKAGIDPLILESKAVTLSRFANKQNAIILNIEPFSYDIVVVSNFIPAVSHTTAWKADAINVKDKAEQLLLALDLALDFHNSHNPEAMIETPIPLVIMGQHSVDADLLINLRTMSGSEIESIAPPINYPADFLLPEYTINVGLALRSIKQTGSDQDYDTYESLAINLLPNIYYPWRPSPTQIFSVTALIILGGMIFPFFQVVSDEMSQTSAIELQYRNLNKILEQKKQEISSIEPLVAAINEYETIINMAGYFTEDISRIEDLAENLSVQLLSVEHDGTNINISCDAENNSTLRQFTTALENSGQFTKVTLPNTFWVYPLPTNVIIELESKIGK
ncbi:hypothetical protein ACFLWF_01485 [Chloroflexota bacterium]